LCFDFRKIFTNHETKCSGEGINKEDKGNYKKGKGRKTSLKSY
jgi:hypothetical protein